MTSLSIEKADFRGKRVLVRVDFNVEFDGEKLEEKYRILAAKPTIDFISCQRGAQIALLSHLGRPAGFDKKFSFENIYKKIGEIIGLELVFVDDCVGGKVAEALVNLKNGQVLMLENVRFYGEEEKGDEKFAEKLAANFDLYVNEAFGVSHRGHASLAKIGGFLPVCFGFNFKKEIEQLEKARDNFERPAVAIIGGAKIETKLPLINFLSKIYDYVLVGGKLGIEAESQKISFAENVILPEDYKDGDLDIGPETAKRFCSLISGAKMIVWNGPMGQFENPLFGEGTKIVLKAISGNKIAYKICGGGETVQFLEQNNAFDAFDFVSTGGGAMLKFLIEGTLPVLI